MRIDLVKLRKRAGMNQRELAELLQVRPSFLSAIENGHSRLPDEKLEKIKDIFELESLEEYVMKESEERFVPPHTHADDQSDSIAKLLNHFHDLAHQQSKMSGNQEAELTSRIDFLTKRNDRLSDRLDDLREEVDKLRSENYRLKELLVKNSIQIPE